MSSSPNPEMLIARLQEAATGSEELDSAICDVALGHAKGETRWHEFSRSTDAAMTLLPEGWVSHRISQSFSGPWYVTLFPPPHHKAWMYGLIDAKGQTMPLAICLAALHARNLLRAIEAKTSAASQSPQSPDRS